MPEIQTFDNDFRIFYSQTMNIYSSKLLIKNIYGYNFTFNFEKNVSSNETGIAIIPNDNDRTVTVNLKNFSSPLGVGTTTPIKILMLTPEDGTNEEAVHFSVFARSLSETTTYLQVTVTFYAK